MGNSTASLGKLAVAVVALYYIFSGVGKKYKNQD